MDTKIIFKDNSEIEIDKGSFSNQIILNCSDWDEIAEIRKLFTQENTSSFTISRSGGETHHEGLHLSHCTIQGEDGDLKATFFLEETSEQDQYITAAKILLGQE